jgi:thiol:disulfide interchange protein
MEKKIKWESSLDAALARARAEQKPVFLDFFNPH